MPELETPPVIDGHLTDPVWSQATRLDAFCQNVLMVAAIPAEGRSEFYVYYSADTIYFGLRPMRSRPTVWSPPTARTTAKSGRTTA